MKVSVIYVPIAGVDEAKRLIHKLLELKLIACGNIFSTGISIYEWEGKIIEEPEVYILFKTREELLPELFEKIGHLHSYSIPSLLQLSIEKANDSFIEWVYMQTKEPYVS